MRYVNDQVALDTPIISISLKLQISQLTYFIIRIYEFFHEAVCGRVKLSVFH